MTTSEMMALLDRTIRFTYHGKVRIGKVVDFRGHCLVVKLDGDGHKSFDPRKMQTIRLFESAE